MNVVLPSGATDATFYVTRHPIKSISNSIIDFDLRNIESVLPDELKKETKRITERINSHYLKSRQIETRSYGEKGEDDFQQYNWGLSLIREMGLFTDQAELLMVLYARDVEGRITEKEFHLMVALHTSFRHLPKYKKKLIWKDLMSSWKINMKKGKFLPPTISKKAFIRILEVNFIDFDLNIDQISKDFMKFDAEADYLQSLLLDDPILRGEIPQQRKQHSILPLKQSQDQIDSYDKNSLGLSFSNTETGTSAQDRQRTLKLQKSFSHYDELDKERLRESESARREAVDASHDELALRVQEIKRERQIKRLQEMEKAEMEASAELLESTRSIPSLERSLTTLHIPISLPGTARKGYTPRTALNSSRPSLERSTSYSPPPQTKKLLLPKSLSLPIESHQLPDFLIPTSPQPDMFELSSPSTLPNRHKSEEDPLTSRSIESYLGEETKELLSTPLPTNNLQFLESATSETSDNSLLNQSKDLTTPPGDQHHYYDNQLTSNDLITDYLHPIIEDSISSSLCTSPHPVPLSPLPLPNPLPPSPPLSTPQEIVTIDVDPPLDVSAYSISEEASQPAYFPNLTDLFELPYHDLLINVPKTGNVLRILIRHDDEGDASGLFVHGFIPYSRAEEQGLIKVGDEIITVNNFNVEGKELEDVVAALKNHHEEFVPIMIRRRDPILTFASGSTTPWVSPRLPRRSISKEESPRPFTTEDGDQPEDFPDFSDLFTLPAQNFLFTIPKTNGQLRIMIRHDDDGVHKGLFIHGFRPFSNAETQGLLKVGDEILEIDGISVAGGKLEDLIDVLKSNTLDTVEMLICRRDLFPDLSSEHYFSPRRHSTDSNFLCEATPSSSFRKSIPASTTTSTTTADPPSPAFIKTTKDELMEVPRTDGILRVIIKKNEDNFYVHGFKGKCFAEEVLRPGDVILEIDGIPLSGLSLKEVAEVIKNCTQAKVPMRIRRSYSFS